MKDFRVNGKQSPSERRGKYWLLRSHNVNSYTAMRLRDWRLPFIEVYLNYRSMADTVAQERDFNEGE